MAVVTFLTCFRDTLIDIFSKTYVSLIALIVLYVSTLLFALKGSVGCAPPPAPWDIIHLKGKLTKFQTCLDLSIGDQWLNGFAPHLRRGAFRGFKVRTGGYAMCCLFAFVHTLAHLTMAIILMLLLEIGIYTCIKSVLL